MKVLFAASESAPFFKTGGLGDVAYALPKELKRHPGMDIRVVLPQYRQLPQEFQDQLHELCHFRFQLGYKNVYCGIKSLELEGLTYYFVDNLAYFDRTRLYGDWDDGERFAFFSTAIIEMLEVIDWIPDIIHVNDWQTAMVPSLLVDRYHWKQSLKSIRKVLTIHNLRFQGVYEPEILPNVFGTGYNIFTEDGAKKDDRVNFLKSGINFSDRVTTVSPTYSREILTPEFGEGLEGVLAYNQWKLKGIINGIDYDLNNPGFDPRIAYHFDRDHLEGKAQNKRALQERLDLEPLANRPLIAMVSRLTDQKGCQLLETILDSALEGEVQVVVLGTGDRHFEESFCYFQYKYPDKMRAWIGFDVQLAQEIYAGADLFLMPSAFEPCGLSQMIAMRYGTLPLVHETGGLKDTVQAYNQFTSEGTGFSFNSFNPQTLKYIWDYAVETYYQRPDHWRAMMQSAMQKDFSWKQPAQEYLKLYEELLAE